MSSTLDRAVVVIEDPSAPERPRGVGAQDGNDDGPVEARSYRRTATVVDHLAFEALASQSLYAKDARNQQPPPGQPPPAATGANWVPRAGILAFDGLGATIGDFVLRLTIGAKGGALSGLLLVEISYPPAPRLPAGSTLLRDMANAVLPAELASTLRIATPAWTQYGIVDPSDEGASWSLPHTALAYLDVLRAVSAT